MLQIIIPIFKNYFQAKDAYNAYRGPDKYSYITTNFTQEHIKLSNDFFGLQEDLEITLNQLKKEHANDNSKLYWYVKTWYDIHCLAKENPSRMIHTNGLNSLCVEIMKLSDEAEKELRNYLSSI